MGLPKPERRSSHRQRTIRTRRHLKGLGTALQDALATDELLHDIFSEQLTEKLRPPTVRWLRDRTKSVSADTVEYTGGAYVKTEWTIELEPESNRGEQSPRTLEFHTDDPIQQDSQRFRVDYRQLFRQQIRCSNTWWTDLSRYWITSATVEDIVDDDYPTEDESAFRSANLGRRSTISYGMKLGRPSVVMKPVQATPDNSPQIRSRCQRHSAIIAPEKSNDT